MGVLERHPSGRLSIRGTFGGEFFADPDTGAALSPLVSWQDRRTAERCAKLTASPEGELISGRTGLPVDPMFSAPKMRWLLDSGIEDNQLVVRGKQPHDEAVCAWLEASLVREISPARSRAAQLRALDATGRANNPFTVIPISRNGSSTSHTSG